MKKIITLLLILLFATKSTFSQSPNNIEKFVVVSVNDKDSILNKIKMSAPQFYNIGKGGQRIFRVGKLSFKRIA